jgi:hypothetical protein
MKARCFVGHVVESHRLELLGSRCREPVIAIVVACREFFQPQSQIGTRATAKRVVGHDAGDKGLSTQTICRPVKSTHPQERDQRGVNVSDARLPLDHLCLHDLGHG